MELGDIEIFLKTKFNEDILVLVKCVEADLHCVQSL
jgi:hypothetical protein